MMNAKLAKKRGNNAIFTGLVIVALGVIWLLRKMDVMIPHWMISWQMILIVIGIAIGVSSNFRNPASWILSGIGFIFLINDIYFIPFEIREYFWPVLVIVIGLIILLKPKRNRRWREEFQDRFKEENTDNNGSRTTFEAGSSTGSYTKGDVIDSVSVFNGIKKMILSKNFKGGESVTVFGGTEINLLQADMDKIAELDVTVVFGGLKLIVPKHWEVRTEVTSIFAGIEDKRYSAVEVIKDEKTLILTGSLVFGGIDIVSH